MYQAWLSNGEKGVHNDQTGKKIDFIENNLVIYFNSQQQKKLSV